MSRSWNGQALVNELSALLGDSSTTFKERVLGWANDVIFDISTRHDWGYHLTKGKKILAADSEANNLEVAAPDAPSVSLLAGGFLSSNTNYQVLLTYVQANGVETLIGTPSEVVTTTASNLSFLISNIPTSSESLVSGRRIYLKEADGNYFLHSLIDDNFTTTASIQSKTTSPIEPPDYESIRRLNGSPFFEQSPSVYLIYKDIDQLRLLVQGQWASGNPQYFSPIESNSISTYPMPNQDMEVSFNYYRAPFKLYATADSQPDLPIYLKTALKAGVIALGYEYRDRAGQELKRANYENAIVDAINRGARVANIDYSINDVYGNINAVGVL